MFLIRTQSGITNQNAPFYAPDPGADAILALGPSLWLEADSRFLEVTGTDVVAWIDRVSARKYVPGAARPKVETAGANKALRMAATPLSPDGGFDIFTDTGTHTLAALVRFPVPGTEGMAAPGNQIVGTNSSNVHNYQLLTRLTNGGLDVAQGGVAINGLDGAAKDLRDGDWHLIVESVPSTPGVATESQLRIDGLTVQTYSSLKPPAVEGERQLIIGATGAGAGPMSGFIAGLMYIPRRALHQHPTQLAILEAYWTERLIERSA